MQIPYCKFFFPILWFAMFQDLNETAPLEIRYFEICLVESNEIEGKARPGAVKPKGRGGHGLIHACWQHQDSSRAVDDMAAARWPCKHPLHCCYSL